MNSTRNATRPLFLLWNRLQWMLHVVGDAFDITRILSKNESGDPSAAESLLPLAYQELRKLATRKLAHEKAGLTLQATALVHEAYGRTALLCRSVARRSGRRLRDLWHHRQAVLALHQSLAASDGMRRQRFVVSGRPPALATGEILENK